MSICKLVVNSFTDPFLCKTMLP